MDPKLLKWAQFVPCLVQKTEAKFHKQETVVIVPWVLTTWRSKRNILKFIILEATGFLCVASVLKMIPKTCWASLSCLVTSCLRQKPPIKYNSPNCHCFINLDICTSHRLASDSIIGDILQTGLYLGLPRLRYGNVHDKMEGGEMSGKKKTRERTTTIPPPTKNTPENSTAHLLQNGTIASPFYILMPKCLLIMAGIYAHSKQLGWLWNITHPGRRKPY